MKNLKEKLTSRKFLVAAAGVVSGLILIISGNVEEGSTTIIASAVAYLAAEGIIDAVAVKKAVDEAWNALEQEDVDFEDLK